MFYKGHELRTFHLFRHEDVSGVSGVGIVAEGLIFSTGKVVIQWTTDHHSIVIYDSLEDAIAIHGHGGKTEFIFPSATRLNEQHT